jgi:hypothetical protein
MEDVEHRRFNCTFDEAVAEFASEHRPAILAFACGDAGHWNRRFAVRVSPALALQLAIEPRLKNARRMLDEHYPFDEVAAAARLQVPRHTRPAQLRVVGRKVRLVETIAEGDGTPNAIANLPDCHGAVDGPVGVGSV